MNEWIKSGVYVGVAVVLAVTAYLMQPAPRETVSNTLAGQSLFPKFTDPLESRGLEIVNYNADLAEVDRFEVAMVDSEWVLTTHKNYPADATDGLEAAASSIVDMKIIDVATELPAEHEDYGVVDPKSEKLKAGQKGVGTLVRIKGSGGSTLAEMIVGGKVKDREGLRFVRVPGQDAVFLAKFDLDSLSTSFQDWIETDLLNFETAKLADLTLKDYVLQFVNLGNGRLGVQVSHNSEMKVRPKSENEWELLEFKLGKGGELESTVLLDQEELNHENLQALRTSLADLKFVDVERKPVGMSSNLAGNITASEDLINNQETRRALQAIGIIPSFDPATKTVELLASNGELVIGMNGGYEYVLRFGLELDPSSSSESDEIRRYAFVMARLRDDQFKEPTPLPLPDLPEKPSDGSSDADFEDKIAEIKAQRTKIQETNDARLKEFEDRKRVAENRIRDLNERFADWFFIISDDVFKKLRLSREDVLKESAEAIETGFGIDAFRKLEEFNPE